MCIQFEYDFPVKSDKWVGKVKVSGNGNCGNSSIDSADDEGGSLWGFMILAFVSGLAAIFTPCVFPMIPLTVSFFSSKCACYEFANFNIGLKIHWFFLPFKLFHLLGKTIEKIFWNISLVSKGKWPHLFLFPSVLRVHKNRKLLSSARLMGRSWGSKGNDIIKGCAGEAKHSELEREKTPQLDPLARVSTRLASQVKMEKRNIIITSVLGKGRKLKCVELRQQKVYVRWNHH